MKDGKLEDLVYIHNGAKVVIDDIEAEVMGPEFSKHTHRLIAIYEAAGSQKLCVVYDGTRYFIYKFRRHSDMNPFWSTEMSHIEIMSNSNYKDIAKKCVKVFWVMFGE